MALPTTEKSWLFKAIHIPQSGSFTIDSQYAMFNIKQALTTAAGWTDQAGNPAVHAHPWTVTASSAGTIGTTGTSDYWVAKESVVSSSLNFSWMMLRQPQINPLFEICLGFPSNGLTNIALSGSSLNGYTLTSLLPSAMPTATDKVDYYTNSAFISGMATWGASIYILMSTDGQCTRLFCYLNGSNVFFWLFEKPKNPITGWNNSYIALAYPSVYTTYGITDNAYIKSNYNGLPISLYATTEFYGTAAIGENQLAPNSITGEWPMTPIGLCSTTPGAYGRIGEIYDMWFTSTSVQVGTSFPLTGSKDFMVMPNIVIPWDQSELITY